MRKIFIRYFLIIMIVTVGAAIAINSLIQTVFARVSAEKAGRDVIANIAERIDNNDRIIGELISGLNENYISRAKAFAEIIAQNPSVIESYDEMVRIADVLNVDEVHVTDEKGILRWGNVISYYGLDFAKTEQTRPFMPALTDKNFELAQEPQPNGSEGKMFQYISVARQDKTGIVQVAVSPDVLNNTLANNKIDVLISNYNVSAGEHVFAIDKNSGEILADSNGGYIGKNYSDIGISDDFFYLKKDSGKIKIGDEEVFAIFGIVDDYIITVTYDDNVLYNTGKNQNFVAIISSTLLGLVIILAIFRMLKNIVIDNLENINGHLKMIGDGNLDVTVEIDATPEFAILSGGINEMAQSIKSQMLEIKNQSEELEKSNENILASLKYARKIQDNLLPSNSSFERAFKDYSILWEPKDVVGGDIYWIRNFRKEEGALLCVCDCTGHGTPGALLTMLVASCLDSIVTSSNASNPALIMWELEKKLFGNLNAADNMSPSSIKDGADVAILFINENREILMSSANMHVFVCDGEKTERLKGQKLKIGEGQLESIEQIKTITIPADSRNSYYIASDGLFDQIGQETHVPFGYRKFQQIILDNHHENQTYIVQKVWEEFTNHMGNEERRDDITLVGFKL